eukprot:scaffold54625_cov24-Tisochrysis_lutea.AAC.1
MRFYGDSGPANLGTKDDEIMKRDCAPCGLPFLVVEQDSQCQHAGQHGHQGSWHPYPARRLGILGSRRSMLLGTVLAQLHLSKCTYSMVRSP